MTRTLFIKGIDADKALSSDPIYHNILDYLRDYILKEQDKLDQISPDFRPAVAFFVPKRKELLEMVGIKGNTDKSTIELAGMIYAKIEEHKYQSIFKKVFSMSLDFESENFLWVRIKCDVIGGGF